MHNFPEKERQKKTTNTVFSAENDYPQNKKINFFIFYNDLCVPLNSNRFIKFLDLGNFFSWKYRMDHDILIIEETDIGGVENG